MVPGRAAGRVTVGGGTVRATAATRKQLEGCICLTPRLALTTTLIGGLGSPECRVGGRGEHFEQRSHQYLQLVTWDRRGDKGLAGEEIRGSQPFDSRAARFPIAPSSTRAARCPSRNYPKSGPTLSLTLPTLSLMFYLPNSSLTQCIPHP